MSESDGEQAARSVALEQAYVHEVYEQCAEKTAQSRHWPRIYKFLEELEPGALVCDIGCGNGKYLSVNDNVFKVGADRCKRLTDIAREKENEVLICDNLALPFRDESFDAVLSIAVVHHFATTERRVNALKELARVLRIGGRLVISVWAMEQRHRKFESQDVLVPWPKAYCLNAGLSSARPGGKSSTGGSIPCINQLDPERSAQKSLLTSKRNESRKCKKRNYWIDPIFSPSPSTSSLSSPNETCYSFFRRALQKLAGGKRDSGNRAWFLETWQSGGCKNRRNFEIDDIGDVDDIPIELRRLEDDNVTVAKLPDAHSIKSKSLGDILEIQHLDLVRSRSSIPGFSSSLTSEFYLDEESKAPSPLGLEGTHLMRSADDPDLGPSSSSSSPLPPPLPLPQSQSQSQPQPQSQPQLRSAIFSSSGQQSSGSFSSNSKPRLVKQKTHLPDDGTLEFPEKPKNTAIQEFIEELGEFETTRSKRGSVHKQSSMNEELMSMERLMERDRVRRNIMKQASLNEEIICKPSRTFGNFRDTLYSGNATKRFQLIKSGLTNRIKQSTTSMEKVSSMALKNGFVKILQGWKSVDSHVDTADSDGDESKRCKELSAKRKTSVQATTGVSGTWIGTSAGGKVESETIERRLSKEDGSDSSKDSSLQSDTSVDSEDSFASVIYVPTKQQQQQQQQQPHHHHHHHYHHNNFQHHSNSHQLHYEHQFPSLIDVTTIPVGGYQLRTTSAPPSPRIKHPPEIHGPRLKLISISPLLKQFPATSKSLPPPSPPRLSPRNFNLFGPPCNVAAANSSEDTNIFKINADREEPCKSNDATDAINPDKNIKNFFGDDIRSDAESLDANCTPEKSIKIDESPSRTDETITPVAGVVDDVNKVSPPRRSSIIVEKPIKLAEVEEKNSRSNANNNAVTVNRVERVHDDAKPNVDSVEVRWGTSGDNISEKSSSESINDEDSRGSRLKQIKELLKQKPGFATRCGRSSFPLVRRASTATSGRPDSADARTLPRLLSLELFNPETDDLDSDSSGLSSPESVGSVISVISDERFTLKNKDKNEKIGGSNRPEEMPSRCSEIATDVIPDNDDKRRQDITDKVGEDTTNEPSERIAMISKVPIDSASDTVDSSIIKTTHTRLSELSLIESYEPTSISPCVSEEAIDLSSLINNCKYSQLMDDTIAWLRGATGTDNDYHYSEYTDNNSCCASNDKESSDRKSLSEDTMDFVMVTKNGECIGVKDIGAESEGVERATCTADASCPQKEEPVEYPNIAEITISNAAKKNKTLERGDSHESTEIEGSISASTDATSRTGSLNNSRFCGGSATCLVSGNLEYKSLRERRKYLYQKRSASEETRGSSDANPSAIINRRADDQCDGVDAVVGRASPSLKSVNMSGSSSQESPISDYDGDDFGGAGGNGGGSSSGGAITYHQYYHVFREGELDQLINKYVENLHIISSYYDHASWCIVAEKVQVWTI